MSGRPISSKPLPAAGSESTLIHNPESWVEPIDLDALFPRSAPLEVELGSGDGGFMLAYAAAHPGVNFIAVERLKGRFMKLEKKGRRAGLQNLKLLRIEASYFVRYLLPPHQTRAFHIYFPDPWPKRRHHKHRLIQPAFAEHLARALAPGGSVFLRTDNPDYFHQFLATFQSHPQFSPRNTPADLAAFPTDFERDFHQKGIVTHRTAWKISSIR